MRRRPKGDDGTILVLLLGFTAVLLLMVAVVVNVSSVILAKRSLASAADGAAVAAAQELDLSRLYEVGLGAGAIPLSPAQVRERVERYQREMRQPGLELAGEVTDDRTTAIVRAVRRVELPFGRLLGFRPVLVRAEARARAPVAP